jgi:hypothetical protein
MKHPFILLALISVLLPSCGTLPSISVTYDGTTWGVSSSFKKVSGKEVIPEK